MNIRPRLNSNYLLSADFAAFALVLAIVVTITRAWALTNLFEILLVALVLCNSSLRSRVFASVNDARVFFVLLFWAWVAITTSWSNAPISERFDEVWSWRKLMLVPICFALFQDETRKHLLMLTVVITCSFFMIATWLAFFELIEFDRSPSHFLENHATQGVLFGASALFCVLLSLDRPRRKNILLFSFLGLGFLANILFISTGRSGYVFLLVIAGFSVFFGAKKVFRTNLVAFGACAFAVGIILSIFLANETTYREINKAVNNIETAYQSEHVTSMGIRIVMWKNSIDLISAKPLLGSGAGGFKYDYEALVAGQDGRPVPSWRSRVVDDPHQQYLHIAAEHGLVGLFLFFLAIGCWLFSKVPKRPIFYVAGIAILLGTMANGLANGHFSAFVEGRFAWITVAAYLAGTQSFLPQLKIFDV